MGSGFGAATYTSRSGNPRFHNYRTLGAQYAVYNPCSPVSRAVRRWFRLRLEGGQIEETTGSSNIDDKIALTYLESNLNNTPNNTE